MASPDLILDEKHAYWVDGKPAPGVNEILKDVGIINDQWYTEDARERGTETHKAIAYYLTNSTMPPLLLPEVKGFFQAAVRFLNDCQFVVQCAETSVYSPNYHYCTTPDAWGTARGKPAIVEFKTGQPARWHGVQLAAQALAINDSASSREKHVWVAYQRVGCYLDERGKY